MGGRVPCPLHGIFMFIFMEHLFFMLKIPCAFLEVGEGEKRSGKIILAFHLQICSVDYSPYLPWV